jgi:hypothetical protein
MKSVRLEGGVGVVRAWGIQLLFEKKNFLFAFYYDGLKPRRNSDKKHWAEAAFQAPGWLWRVIRRGFSLDSEPAPLARQALSVALYCIATFSPMLKKR